MEPLSEQPATPHPPVMMVPPVHPGMMPERLSTWPMVVGVITIVIASLGILTNGCGGVFGQLIQPQISKMVPAGSNPAFDVQMKIAQKYMVAQITNMIVLVSLATLLMTAGIGLIRRRGWSRSGLLVWAILRMLAAIPAAYLSHVISSEMMQEVTKVAATMPSGGPVMPGIFSVMFRVFGVLGIVFSMLFAWSYPIFVLIWFNLESVKREVAAWAARGDQATDIMSS